MCLAPVYDTDFPLSIYFLVISYNARKLLTGSKPSVTDIARLALDPPTAMKSSIFLSFLAAGQNNPRSERLRPNNIFIRLPES